MRRWVVCVALCALGCSEAREVYEVVDASGDAPAVADAGDRLTDSGSPTDAGPTAVDAGTPSVDAGTPSVDAGEATVDSGLRPARVVLNEVRAQGADWVELYNDGDQTADLAGWVVADSDDDGGVRTDEAARLPAGATLAPRTFLVIEADVADAATGAAMQCVMGAVMRCYQANFGISASRGEAVHLLDATGREVDTARYPGGAAVADGQSFARIPDGLGAFAPATPTPGAPNRGL
ncbi:MAG: lamin tail domain-containing protein [Polyangiales bacterium]